MPKELSQEDINQLGIDYGFGTDMPKCEAYPDGMLWFDGDPTQMIRAAIQADRVLNGHEE